MSNKQRKGVNDKILRIPIPAASNGALRNSAPTGMDFVYYSLRASRPAGPSEQSIHPLSKLRGILVQRVKQSKKYLQLHISTT